MSFDAHEDKIRKIFAGDTQLVIPRNQRKYIWEEKQWKELWSDINYIKLRRSSAQTDINHFFCSFVLQECEKKYEIIDGQQRITTLFLILSALCCYFNKLNSAEEHGKTRQYLSGNIGLNSEYLRLENNDLNNISIIMAGACKYQEAFSEKTMLDFKALTKGNKGDERIINCFSYFYNELSQNNLSLNDSVTIREILLDMKVINIASEDELDCYDIFEILNARGVDLEESELLKNYIFKYAQPEYSVDNAKNIWTKIEDNMELCKGNIDLFLVHFVTYRYYKPSKDEGVFRIIKSNTDKNTVRNLLDDLYSASEDYIMFYDSTKAFNKDIQKSLEFYKLVNHRQFRPLFMALFNAYHKGSYNEKQLSKICVFLKNFSFAYTLVMGNSSNLIETSIYDLAGKIYKNPTIETLNLIKQKLKKFYPGQNDFTRAFCNLGFSNKNKNYSNSNNRKRMKYIFEELEDIKQATAELFCDTKNCDLEHIMNDSEFDDITSKVGNILLISSKLNKKMNDYDFAKKKKILKQSQLITVQNFLHYYENYDEWTNNLIIQRTETIAKEAYNSIWKLDTNDI